MLLLKHCELLARVLGFFENIPAAFFNYYFNYCLKKCLLFFQKLISNLAVTSL